MASIQYVVNATDAASGVFARIAASADGLDKQLEDLGKRVADPEVNLKDTKFTLGIVRAAQRLDKLNAMIADPEVTVDTAKAQTEILRINAMLDRLDAKRVNVTVDVNRRGGIFGALTGLFGAGGGAGGAAAAGAPAAAGPVAGFLGSPAGIGTAAAAAGPLAALLSALLGQGAGTATAGAGAGLVAMFRPAMLAPALSNIKRTLSTVAGVIGPSVGLMFAQFGKSVQALAPVLTKLFAASLPFMQQFFTILGQGAKVILPALTQMLQQMVKSGALKTMTQAFVILLQGVAGFIRGIGGPAMKAGALIFRALAIGLAGVLVALGKTLSWLGGETLKWFHNVRQTWDVFRHYTAVIFDGARHDIAAAWNAISLITGKALGAIVRAAASAWDILVRATKTALGIIVQYFYGVPSRILHALFGLGHSLYGFAHAAFSEMWSGFKNVGGTILGWITGWASSLWHGLLHFFHIGSPSGLFYDIGKNLMLGLRNGIQDHIRHASGAAMAAAKAVTAQAARTGSVAVEQRYAAGLLGSYGWPGGEMGPLIALWNRESGWNPYAVNPSSGAYGIPQSLGHGHPYNLGDYKAQIIWGLNYIAGRYGSPGAAWAHETRFGWYDRGGWLPPGVSVALNTTGRPERVGGGMTVNINVAVSPLASPADTGRKVAEVLAEFKKRGGMIYAPSGF